MKRETAVRMARMQAVTSGGIAFIDGKALTSRNGYWYLDDKKVTDIDKEVLDHVAVDESYVCQLMSEE